MTFSLLYIYLVREILAYSLSFTELEFIYLC